MCRALVGLRPACGGDCLGGDSVLAIQGWRLGEFPQIGDHTVGPGLDQGLLFILTRDANHQSKTAAASGLDSDKGVFHNRGSVGGNTELAGGAEEHVRAGLSG